MKTLIAAQQGEIARLKASTLIYEASIQALRIRHREDAATKVRPKSAKIERAIEQLQLALENLEVAMAAADTSVEPSDAEAKSEAAAEQSRRGRHKARVAADTPRGTHCA
jgi:transposase